MKKTSNPFRYTELSGAEFKDKPSYDLAKLYEQACSELTLQQDKRDYILKSYILLFSIVVPLLLSLSDKITAAQTGAMLVCIGVIGYIYSLIVIRYRVYKESYWVTCTVITQLINLEEASLTKHNIQAMYYKCLKKKWGRCIITRGDGTRRFAHWKIFKSNIFSAESLLFLVMAFFTSAITGMGLYMFIRTCCYGGLVSVLMSLAIFLFLLCLYFRNLKRVFKVLVDETEESFNFAFSKAWFLHFYKD